MAGTSVRCICNFCPGCNKIGGHVESRRNLLGWYTLFCRECGSVWSVWHGLEKITKSIHVRRVISLRSGFKADQASSLLALRAQYRSGEIES